MRKLMLVTVALVVGCQSPQAGFGPPVGGYTTAQEQAQYDANMEKYRIQRQQTLPLSASTSTPVISGSTTDVHVVADGGTFKVPVIINGALTLRFTVDSGASDVSIPADVVMTLMRTGTLTGSDFIGVRTYQLADGSTESLKTFNIRTLKVGSMTVNNVTGHMAGVKGTLLLGQSFLKRFHRWSINNGKEVLELE